MRHPRATQNNDPSRVGETASPDVFQTKPWNAKDFTLPDDARRIPTMLSDEEGRLLYWITREYADGSGAVCDLGCFAGGSTARLAAGVRAAGRQTSVHAFDRFRVGEDQKPAFLYSAGIEPFDGSDMLAAVRQLLSPWRDLIRLQPGDLRLFDRFGEPIEVLFIDASKLPETADHIARSFFSDLIPGRSLIVQQDYLHWRQPWVAAQMELLSDVVIPVTWCREGTVVFRLERQITEDDLDRARCVGLADDQMIDLLIQAIRRFSEPTLETHLARAVLGLRDNPGVRVPPQFDAGEFTPKRIKQVIAQARG